MRLDSRDFHTVLRVLAELYVLKTLDQFLQHSVRLRNEVSRYNRSGWHLRVLRPHLAQAQANARRYSAVIAAAHSAQLNVSTLTPRESEVASWLACGKTNWEIGVICDLRVRTVEKHVERILRELHVENRATAAVRLREVLYGARHQDVVGRVT